MRANKQNKHKKKKSQRCTACKKANKMQYIEFILQLNAKHNGKLFNCDDTWKWIMQVNDYQMLSTLFTASSGSKSKTLIPKEFGFASINSDRRYWRLLKEFTCQTIAESKATELKIQSFELLLKQKQFISLFRNDLFDNARTNSLGIELLTNLTSRRAAKWIKNFAQAIKQTQWNVNLGWFFFLIDFYFFICLFYLLLNKR